MTEHKKHEHSESKGKSSETVTITKTTLWQIISGVLGVLLLISLFTGGFGLGATPSTSGTNTNTVPTNDNAAAPTQPTAAAIATVTTAQLNDGDAMEGSSSAKVTIYEWSDFECPFCARFYTQTYGQIKSNYIDTNKVNLVFRDFPLSFHPQAQKAAEAAACAGEQDKFYAMHDKIFDEGVTGGVATFKQYAADLGLDTTEFNSCLDNGDTASEIAKDMQDGQAVGVTGTPGFLITTTVSSVTVEDVQNAIPSAYSRNMVALKTDKGVGVRISGALPYDAFQGMIDVLLG
ncbi:thioredoxin domain-containing protein [Candidatus Woesearchaeota archaeon]|nr:thioredoxin domain-containing protein [Candidatus Woesearchaeota archaeon]